MAGLQDANRQLAQQAGQLGALSAILDQIRDDMLAYHPDMHPVVRANLDLAMTYKRTLMDQKSDQETER